MFLENLRKKAEEVAGKVFSDENVNAVATVATGVLTSIKDGVSKAVDNLVDMIDELKSDTTWLDNAHEDQRKKFFEDLYNDMVKYAPGQEKKFKRFVDWLQTLRHTDVIGYLEQFNNGVITVDKDGRIESPDFFVKPGTNAIVYKSKCSVALIYGIYLSVSDADEAGANKNLLYACRVTMPNTGGEADSRFPVLYIESLLNSRNLLRDEYIDFVKTHYPGLEGFAEQHRNDPRNQKHTEWRSNVNSFKLSKNKR